MKYVLSKAAFGALLLSFVATTTVGAAEISSLGDEIASDAVESYVGSEQRSAVEEPPAIIIVRPQDEPTRSKRGWLAEQLAVTAFGDSLQYWQAASENEGDMPADTKNNLADIGRSYTSNSLPALGELDDFLIFTKHSASSTSDTKATKENNKTESPTSDESQTQSSGDNVQDQGSNDVNNDMLADTVEDDTVVSAPKVYSIGDIYNPSPNTKKTVKGVFTTYHEKNIDITVYTGPDESRLINNQLRGQGATYFYPVGAITNIHATDKQVNTVRDIGVGSSRMEMIFAYGSPNAMWRDSSNESYIFLYKGDNEKAWTEKKEFTPIVANTNSNSQSMDTIKKGESYIAFTIKNNNIEAIDLIDGQVWSRFGLPEAAMYDFNAGQLSDDDFVLRGLRLNQKFTNDSNSEWRTQGMLFGSSFIGYNEYGVSVDKSNLINRVLLNVYTPTRRGISMGDTKYLLLFVYGMPTRIVESNTDNGTATVYEYKNPRSNSSYLQFALDDKNQYIKSVMLSDRPVK